LRKLFILFNFVGPQLLIVIYKLEIKQRYEHLHSITYEYIS